MSLPICDEVPAGVVPVVRALPRKGFPSRVPPLVTVIESAFFPLALCCFFLIAFAIIPVGSGNSSIGATSLSSLLASDISILFCLAGEVLEALVRCSRISTAGAVYPSARKRSMFSRFAAKDSLTFSGFILMRIFFYMSLTMKAS